MANVIELKRIKLNGYDRMALEKYSKTYMEYSYFTASIEAAAFRNISREEKTEISYENHKTSLIHKK